MIEAAYSANYFEYLNIQFVYAEPFYKNKYPINKYFINMH